MPEQPARAVWLGFICVGLVLVSTFTSLYLTSPSRAEKASLDIGWNRLSTFGAAEGAELSTLGVVGDLALNSHGNVVALDIAKNRVAVLDQAGKVLHAFGGKGHGPGELSGPVALALGPQDRVYVLDRVNQRVEIFDTGEGVRTGSFRMGMEADDLCFMNDRLFLLGAFRGHLIHEVSPSDGRVIRSFAPDADAADPLVSGYRMNGYLECGPEDQIAFLPLLRPEVMRFRASTGVPLSTARIPGYRPVQVHRDRNGSVIFKAPGEGGHDYASSIIPLPGGDKLVQVGLISKGATSRHEFASVRSFLLSRDSNVIHPVTGDVPRLIYSRGDTALAALTSPYPAIWILQLQLGEQS